jgi:poly(3-hydroxybutyrate) depolymerase
MFDLRGLVAQTGANQVAYEDPGNPGRPIILYSARPCHFTADTPLVIVHHGASRNGDAYRDFWLPSAEQAGLFIVAPELSNAAFPGGNWYNMGALVDDEGHPRSRESWIYGLDGRIYSQLLAQGVTRVGGYAVWGHSAGGQLVHRAMSLGFRNHVIAAVAANSGSYAMPDLAINFPYGLGGLGIDEAGLAGLLAFPLTIMAGEQDIDATTANFPKQSGAMAQGGTRFARAHAYHDAGQAAARALGAACGWSIIDVPGVAHDGQRMAEAAAPVLSRSLRGRRGARARGVTG